MTHNAYLVGILCPQMLQCIVWGTQNKTKQSFVHAQCRWQSCFSFPECFNLLSDECAKAEPLGAGGWLRLQQLD